MKFNLHLKEKHGVGVPLDGVRVVQASPELVNEAKCYLLCVGSNKAQAIEHYVTRWHLEPEELLHWQDSNGTDFWWMAEPDPSLVKKEEPKPGKVKKDFRAKSLPKISRKNRRSL